MPSISDRIGTDLSGYMPAAPPPATQQQEQPLLPTRSPLLRFPAPYLAGTFPSSDTLLGYHLGGQIPQWRIPVPPPVLTGNAVSTAVGTTTVISGGSSTTTTKLVQKSQSVTTPTISPGQTFTGSVTLSTAYALNSISTAVPARIRLYTTASAQSTDLTRPVTQGAGFGTEQGLVCDVNLDTAPVVWTLDPVPVAIGTNAASFISVTNLGSSSAVLNVTLNFVVLVT